MTRQGARKKQADRNAGRGPIRVKICGITRIEDALAAAHAGADAIGFVFADSPRRVSKKKAKEIVDALPPYVSAVGVFVNSPTRLILNIVRQVGLSEVQLHGEESPRFVAKLRGLRMTKAVHVRDASFVDEVAAYRDAGVQAVLLDAFSAERRGGTGQRFDWDLVTQAQKQSLTNELPLILSGGLTPANVKRAIGLVRPWGVDVSTGVEIYPGIKSAEKINRFIAAVRNQS